MIYNNNSEEIQKVLDFISSNKYEKSCATFHLFDHLYLLEDVPSNVKEKKPTMQAIYLIADKKVKYGYYENENKKKNEDLNEDLNEEIDGESKKNVESQKSKESKESIESIEPVEPIESIKSTENSNHSDNQNNEINSDEQNNQENIE